MRKGLTPVIAMILLLMMTVAAAGASFYWLLGLQSELQGGTTQFQEQTFERMTSDVNYLSGTFDRDGNGSTNSTLMLTIQNTGTTKIPINNVTANPAVQWTLYDSERDFICTSNWNGTDVDCRTNCGTDLLLKEVKTMNLTITGSGSCDLTNSTTYPDDSLVSFDISFSGKASLSGTFRVDT